MPVEIEPDIDQRRADAFMRERLAQHHPANGHIYGYAVPLQRTPQRDSSDPQNSTNEQFSHES